MTDEYKDVVERLERINFPPEYDDGYFEAIDKAIALLKRYREGLEYLGRNAANPNDRVIARKTLGGSDECKVNKFSSRICERGTKSCEAYHDD